MKKELNYQINYQLKKGEYLLEDNMTLENFKANEEINVIFTSPIPSYELTLDFKNKKVELQVYGFTKVKEVKQKAASIFQLKE